MRKAILLLSVLVALSLVGCRSTSNYILTGTARPAIAPESVKVYDAMPPGAEIIGIITAEGYGSSQSYADAALKRLKQAAGKIGANGVVVDTPEQGSFWISWTFDHTTILKAKAIFVP